MADQVKQTKLAINKKKQEAQGAETERETWAAQASILPNLSRTTSNATQLVELEKLIEISGTSSELEDMRQEMEGVIAAQDAILARVRPEIAALEAELPQAPEPDLLKFDPEKHPRARKTTEKLEPEKQVVFSIGDMCEAQWTDKSWYRAKIQSILGSASAPKYLVRFIEYDDTSTVDRSEIRPLPSKRKREAEPAAGPAPNTPVTSTPHVISGPASVNPNAQPAKTSAANDEEPKKANRVPNKGVLKKRATQWQDFQAKAGKKMPKKESMFRTSQDPGSKGMGSPRCLL